MFDFYFLLPESSEFKIELVKHILANISSKKYTITTNNYDLLNKVLLDLNRKEICNSTVNKELYTAYLNYLLESRNYGLLNK
jgi:hypothetical protein